MPFFQSKNLVFVHVPKTAGTSIERALGMTLKWPSLDRLSLFGPYQGMQLQHLTAMEMTTLGFVSESDFKQSYKFAFVRNPYTRAASEYFFDKKWNKKTKNLTFIDFLKLVKDSIAKRQLIAHYRPQVDFVLDQNERLLVNFLGRFENLSEDWERLQKKLSISNAGLPHENHGEHSDYAEFYSDEAILLVNDIYGDDFRCFGYEIIE